MLYTVLTELTALLNEYLNAFYDVPEGMAELGSPDTSDEEPANKLLVTLLNIERETAMGIAGNYQPASGGTSAQKNPAWHLNLYFTVAAVFDKKRYAESLKALSKALGFLQQQSTLRLADGQAFSLEPVTANTQELTNLWSILGGKYYPSVICKIRKLTIDGNEIKSTARQVGGLDTHTY